MSDPSPIRFRPHHLLCMLTHIGKGYSKIFTENMGNILEQINAGETDIILEYGPDDICTPRLCDKDDVTCHCRELHIDDRDNEALADFAKSADFAMFKIGNRFRLTKDLIQRLRDAYKTNDIRTACHNCEWYDLCNDITQNGFKGTKLK